MLACTCPNSNRAKLSSENHKYWKNHKSFLIESYPTIPKRHNWFRLQFSPLQSFIFFEFGLEATFGSCILNIDMACVKVFTLPHMFWLDTQNLSKAQADFGRNFFGRDPCQICDSCPSSVQTTAWIPSMEIPIGHICSIIIIALSCSVLHRLKWFDVKLVWVGLSLNKYLTLFGYFCYIINICDNSSNTSSIGMVGPDSETTSCSKQDTTYSDLFGLICTLQNLLNLPILVWIRWYNGTLDMVCICLFGYICKALIITRK